jgi:hypothetical protein
LLRPEDGLALPPAQSLTPWEVDMKVPIASILCALLVFAGVAFASDFNVAAGQPVTSSRAPADGYPDPEGTKLTDGSFAFSWADMVGFEGSAPIALVVDLGETFDEITYVALKLMRSDPSFVVLPQSFIVSVSEDGVLYEDLGMGLTFLEGEVPNDTIGTMVWADEQLPGYGRFVRVEVRPGGDAWTMIAELEVGNGPVPADAMPAPAAGAPTTAEPATVSVGQPYTLVPEPAASYPDDAGTKVTDGSYAYAWADMIGFDAPAQNPVVVIDLGERVEGITRVAGLFMRSFASAVNFPSGLIVSVSDDGDTFRDVGLATRTVPDPFTNEYINSLYWEDLANPVAARYVRVEVRPRGDAWTMLAEVMVQTGAAVPEVEEP